jgi:hypothetical protein
MTSASGGTGASGATATMNPSRITTVAFSSTVPGSTTTFASLIA